MRLNILAICLLIARCGMTPLYAERLTTELSECETLLAEAESVLMDLLTENDALRTERETSWIECERIVQEEGETVAAEAEKRHEEIVAVLNRRCLWTCVGVGAAGAVVGFIAGLAIGALL